MLLKKLVLKDIGTYAGLQEFDLVPKVKYGAKRPIILFGGLNGSGKTTFLAAVRLALYGRQSLDALPTQKEYEDHLIDLIHRPRQSLVRSTQARVALDFEYSRMGVRSSYSVVRNWEERGKSVTESLEIFRDEQELPYLSDEQAQAFLNQLVPPGVAQFFFFDGEKIAALAKDDSDVVLADAIRRLLGLDLVDRLDSDLGVFVRNQRTSMSDKKVQVEVATLNAELQTTADAYAAVKLKTEDLAQRRSAAEELARAKKMELSSQGGAWSVDRGALEEQLEQLSLRRDDCETHLREMLNGAAIFQLAPTLASRVSQLLAEEGRKIEEKVVHIAISERAVVLKKAVLAALPVSTNERKKIDSAIDSWVLGFDVGSPSSSGTFDLSASDMRRTREILEMQAKVEHNQLGEFASNAKDALRQQEAIQDKLAHAPSDEFIKAAFDEMTESAKRVGDLNAQWRASVEEQRRLTWLSIELVRKLRKCEEKLVNSGNEERGQEAAQAAQAMIAEFRGVAAVHKCGLLRRYFIDAFKRLARKDDIVRDAQIDPETFKVTLLDGANREVPKKRLSAGEKQIYAIAMLEALAKTSGRNLPVIIDTPLGRLDSKHRMKLVESYFPVASHQVIVLSTDTEVDTKFYDALSNKISHAFHLSFDEGSGSTEVKSGYFWRQQSEVEVNAT